MNSILLYLSLLIVCSFACDDEYYRYMECLKDEQQNRLRELESELSWSYKSQLKRCFRKTKSEAQSKGLCLIDQDWYSRKKTPFFNHRGCGVCSVMQQFVLNTILMGRPDARYNKKDNPDVFASYDGRKTRKCVHEDMTKITGKVLNKCINKNGGNFELKRFPDFDQTFYRNKINIFKSSFIYMSAEKALDQCKDDQTKERARKSTRCWQSHTKMKNDMRKHCDIAKMCMNRIRKTCRPRVKEISSNLCNCISDYRLVLSNKVQDMISMVKRRAKTAEACVKEVNKALEFGGIDWVEQIHHTLDQCPKPLEPSSDIKLLIMMGCGIWYHNPENDNSFQLKDGLRFVGNFLETLWGRFARFCPCDA